MLNGAFSPWPSFTEEEVDACRDVLLSNKVNYWTGNEVKSFEREFAAWVECEHAIAVANGTVALDLALHGLKVGSNNGGKSSDQVVVTPRTFLASVSSVVNAGAKPIFADVDRISGNLTAESIEEVVTPDTKAVIVVHLAGWPCEMDLIMALANRLGIKVIEDCAQAHGARYKGKSVGSVGHVAAWSFCQDKIMTTGGEGGMVTTNNDKMRDRMWAYKDHGKSWDAVHDPDPQPGYRWLHESFGTNWRMIEMQAAIGRIQLKRMADWSNVRRANAAAIDECLTKFAVEGGPIRTERYRCANCQCDASRPSCQHAQYKLYSYVRPENLAKGWSRDKIVQEILRRGVPCGQGSCSEVYLEKAFDCTGYRPEHRLPNAKALGETSLSFLVHPTLTSAEVQKTCNVLRNVLDSTRNPV